MDVFKSTHKTNASPHFGIHYFEDTRHYRELDLLSWLPELTSLGITWATLLSEKGRAIPEIFIQGLVQAGISTNVKFNFSFKDKPTPSEIAPIVQSYANWGVNSVQFFDRPNEKSSWKAADWTNQDMIAKYLDSLLPFIRMANEYGLKTILPPLQPGGSYWDTEFLRSLLTVIMDRGEQKLFDQIILSVYAWTGKHNLNWGAGGSANWPDARPYFSPPDVEDQRGFRIFDWYNEISRSITGAELPIVLHHCGIPADPYLPHPIQFAEEEQISCNQMIFDLIRPDVMQTENQNLLPLPSNILACNFWVLAANKNDSWTSQAWFNENGSATVLGKAMQQKVLSSVNAPKNKASFASNNMVRKTTNHIKMNSTPNGNHPIDKYILLPKQDWGVSEHLLETIRPFIKRYQPTIGFSVEEAKLSKLVILIGGDNTFSTDQVQTLENAGCAVERINGDGTEIASILAER